VNVVVVQGCLSRPPEERVLPSGDRLVALELRVAGPEQRNESVPVSWAQPPNWVVDLEEGAEIVVRGRVRRRFFRAGGQTTSRTEIVAAQGTLARRARQVSALLQTASDELTAVH